MFCVIYKFTVKSGYDDEFRHHWRMVTQWYYRHAGSLGSRLHQSENGAYIGYAQWPSRHQWAQQRDQEAADLQVHREKMRVCCEAIEVLYTMDVTDDLLQGAVYPPGQADEV